jgi:hypothetical protein
MAIGAMSAGASIVAPTWKRVIPLPSKVLLDEPYPANLPVVPACRACNGSFSHVENFQRPKIRKILARRPALAAVIEAGRHHDDGIMFTVDRDRLRNVILKLARGHMAFEMNEPQLEEPSHAAIAPLISMSSEAGEAFEMHPDGPGTLLPEVGSRMLHRLVFSSPDMRQDGWIVVQDRRYRYRVAAANGYTVRIVLSEYLACEIAWM